MRMWFGGAGGQWSGRVACSIRKESLYLQGTIARTMSYTILYQKQFVKVADDLYIPMVLSGDNNVYESDRRRARSWNIHYCVTGERPWASSAEILAAIDRIREQRLKDSDPDGEYAYEDKRFGWHEGIAIYGRGTTGTTFGMYRSFYKSGIERAMTIEELLEKGVQLKMKLYFHNSEEITKRGKEIRPDVFFSSTEHLVNTVNDWFGYYGEMSGRISFWFSDDWYMENLLDSQKKKKVRIPKKYVESKSFYVLKGPSGYFVKNVKYGYRYAITAEGGRRFLTEKAAENFRKRMRNGDAFYVKLTESQFPMSVPA